MFFKDPLLHLLPLAASFWVMVLIINNVPIVINLQFEVFFQRPRFLFPLFFGGVMTWSSCHNFEVSISQMKPIIILPKHMLLTIHWYSSTLTLELWYFLWSLSFFIFLLNYLSSPVYSSSVRSINFSLLYIFIGTTLCRHNTSFGLWMIDCILLFPDALSSLIHVAVGRWINFTKTPI